MEASFRPDPPHDAALLRPAPAGLQTLAGLGFPHLVLLEKFCQQHRGMEFAFEDYRAFALSRGLRRPHVHQVWGSLAGMGQRMGLYEPTGAYRPARYVRTHGHPVRVLRVKQ